MQTSIDEVLLHRCQWHVETGDCMEVLGRLPDACIDLCVTSPPYFGLRKYKGGTKEIGREQTPEFYIANLVAIFGEVRRALKPWGTLWLNIGDSYGKDGNMLGIPWRTAFALQEEGWFLRSDNLWLKQCPMPISVKGWRWERCRIRVDKSVRGKEKFRAGAHGEVSQNDHCSATRYDSILGLHVPNSATGFSKNKYKNCPGCPKCKGNGGYVLRRGSWRTTTAHEYIFMLSKSEGYFADGYASRQQLAQATIMRDRYTRVLDDPDEQYAVAHDHETISDPETGANLRSFFVFRGENFVGDHYAVYPPDLPALAVQCGTSNKGLCSKCGMPWVRVLEHVGSHYTQWAPGTQKKQKAIDPKRVEGGLGGTGMVQDYATINWRPSCTCKKSDRVSALVLDPFSGSGTTGIACQRTGRRYLGVELNPDYADASRERLRARGREHGVRKAVDGDKPDDRSIFKGLP